MDIMDGCYERKMEVRWSWNSTVRQFRIEDTQETQEMKLTMKGAMARS